MSPTVVWSLCQAFVHKKQTGIEYALNIYNPQRIIPHDIGDLLTPKQLGQNFHLYIFQEKCLSSYAGLWHDTYPYQHIHFGLKMTRFHFSLAFTTMENHQIVHCYSWPVLQIVFKVI